MNFYKAALEKLGWMEVTLWYRVFDDGISFNHLEYGHAQGDRPVPKIPSQKSSWGSGKWSKRIWFVDSTKMPFEVLPEY